MPQIWFICERLCMCLQRARSNRWLCVWQWKENPSLSEAQVQGMALARQATIDMELKHREAVYRDILNKQQTVISVLYGLLLSHLFLLIFTLKLCCSYSIWVTYGTQQGQAFPLDVAQNISQQYDTSCCSGGFEIMVGFSLKFSLKYVECLDKGNG